MGRVKEGSVRFPVVLVLMALVLQQSFGQVPPKREFRGVWLTTLQGLDWPSPADRGNPERQKASLRAILDDVNRMKLNAVVFQVRSRGNAFYRSAIEPWAAELTGTLGKDPGWDPLQFAIDECRLRGLELHAWINMVKIWSGDAAPSRTIPLHVLHAHPDWVKPYKGEYWFDPGIPEDREYLARVVGDLVSRYDVDAVHLDYIRYPEADFPDAETYRRYGAGENKADWRRSNINAIVREVYDRVRSTKPWVQVGSAPIGIYENLPTARGWQALHAVSQDSRRWLREGYHDYVAPQVYWSLSSRGGKIDFAALARDWKQGASGRHVYVGIAPYKNDVKPWLHEHIDAARQQGTEGEMFFRYEHIKGEGFKGRYASYAIPPSMPWRDNIRPNPPRNLTVKRRGGVSVLAWNIPVSAVDGDAARRYVVYRSNDAALDIDDASQIIAVLPGTQTAFEDDAGFERSVYAVTALDRFRNESDAASSVAVAGRIPSPSISLPVPQISEPVVSGGLILLAYTLVQESHVRLRLMDDHGAEAYILIDEHRPSGTHVIGIEAARLSGDIQRYVFEVGQHRAVKPFAWSSAP